MTQYHCRMSIAQILKVCFIDVMLPVSVKNYFRDSMQFNSVFKHRIVSNISLWCKCAVVVKNTKTIKTTGAVYPDLDPSRLVLIL